MSKPVTLDDRQRKAIGDAEALIQEANEKAAAIFREAGIDFVSKDDGTFCRLCDCEIFKPGFMANCRTPGCGHSSGAHVFPI